MSDTTRRTSDPVAACPYDCPDDHFTDGTACGYCGRTFGVPDTDHYPVSGMVNGMDWWLRRSDSRWLLDFGRFGNSVGVISPPTASAVRGALDDLLGGELFDFDIHRWALIDSATEQPTGCDECNGYPNSFIAVDEDGDAHNVSCPACKDQPIGASDE